MLIHNENDTLDRIESQSTTFGSSVGTPENGASPGDMSMKTGNPNNPYQNADSGYARAPQPGMPTYTEAWALIESARRMAVATDYADQDNLKDRNKVRDALRLNWRLWTIFQSELTLESNDQMPDEVRTNMLTLCKYVDKHTVEALKDPVPEKIQTLVEINRNIASGLLQSLEEGGGETQAAQPAEGDTPQEHSEILASVNAKV